MTAAGSAIRAVRENAGLTLQQLADLAECSPSYLSRIERGQRQGTKFFLDHLSRVLAEAVGGGRS